MYDCILWFLFYYLEILILLSTVAAVHFIPTNSCQGFHFLYSFANIFLLIFFFINTTLWCKVIFHTNFSFFLSVEHLFIKPHDHFYILFGGIFVQVLCSFFLHFLALCY